MLKLTSLMLFGLILTNCMYQPKIDTAGRSGTFDSSQAVQITNDLQHCEHLAKQNTNTLVETPKYVYNYYVRAYFLYLLPERELTFPSIYKKCMENRGHSVLK